MKKASILGISLLVAGIVGMTPARVEASSMAVLVVGLETDAASDVFAAGIRYEFGQKGYTMITSPAVAAKLKELRDKHAGGQPVDTAGLAAWGKTNNIDFVQLVVENDCTITVDGVAKSGREQLAQVVRCGVAQYSGRGYYRTRFIPQPNPNPNLGTGYDEMVYVAGGVFEMGCKSGRDNLTTSCNSNETLHWVQLSSFYIGKYAVTQGLWKAVMGSLPSSISGNYLGDDKPVIYVSHNDIVEANGFLAKLNAMTGKSYRLPTEAEWEYAARGCSGGNCESYEFSGSNTIGDMAWYGSNSSSYVHTVGTKLPNKLGLYDMSGNVLEWVSDYGISTYGSGTQSSPLVNPTGPTSGSDRVRRGGGWHDGASPCRVAYRSSYSPVNRDNYYGFRLV
jgi:formylglycine-generating enzyme required for sulfatase activity